MIDGLLIVGPAAQRDIGSIYFIEEEGGIERRNGVVFTGNFFEFRAFAKGFGMTFVRRDSRANAALR